MSVTTVYSDASDGQIDSNNATYLTARSGGTLTVTGTNLRVGQDFTGGLYHCYESFLSFDTTGLTSPVSATLSLVDAVGATASWTIEARAQDFGLTLDTTDWVPGANLSALTLLATFDAASFTGGVYHDFTDVAMAANINAAGFTRMIIDSSRMVAGTVAISGENFIAQPSETAGTTSDPKLTLTFQDPIASFGAPRSRVATQARLG